MSQAICIGDGANDLKMLDACGSGGGVAIAYKAKAKVQQDAPNKLNSHSLLDILYLLDLTAEEFEDLVSGKDNYPSREAPRTSLMANMEII